MTPREGGTERPCRWVRLWEGACAIAGLLLWTACIAAWVGLAMLRWG